MFSLCLVSDVGSWTDFAAASRVSSYFSLRAILATSHVGGGKYISVLFYLASVAITEAAITTKSAPLSASIVIVISLLDCLWRYRQAPGEAGARLDN